MVQSTTLWILRDDIGLKFDIHALERSTDGMYSTCLFGDDTDRSESRLID